MQVTMIVPMIVPMAELPDFVIDRSNWGRGDGSNCALVQWGMKFFPAETAADSANVYGLFNGNYQDDEMAALTSKVWYVNDNWSGPEREVELKRLFLQAGYNVSFK